jgi:hypothetical protein
MNIKNTPIRCAIPPSPKWSIMQERCPRQIPYGSSITAKSFSLYSRTPPAWHLQETEPPVKDYLIRTGTLDWYMEESSALAERPRNCKDNKPRPRIAHHRLPQDAGGIPETLCCMGMQKKQRAKLFLSLTRTNADTKQSGHPIVLPLGRTDLQIADDVLQKSKL